MSTPKHNFGIRISLCIKDTSIIILKIIVRAARKILRFRTLQLCSFISDEGVANKAWKLT
jgi:hypothetical protein